MKYLYITLFATLAIAGCDTDETVAPRRETQPSQAEVPDGCFVVRYDFPAATRAVIGDDTRITDLRYLLFKDDGTFVKERQILSGAGTTSWPLADVVLDTLPNGSYRAVFAGNMAGELLTGYDQGYSAARINMPSAELTGTSEFYKADVSFSNESAPAPVELQRIVSVARLHRNVVDAQAALNGLVQRVVDEIDAGQIITDQINAVLPNQLAGALQPITNLLDQDLSTVTQSLVDPLYDLLLQQLVDQLGRTLVANTDQNSTLPGTVGALINPWNQATAQYVVATIDNFPRSMTLDLVVDRTWPAGQQFMFSLLNPTSLGAMKDLYVRGLGGGTYDIRQINVVQDQTLIGGFVVDRIVDGALITGSLVDIVDPITIPVAPNVMYSANYSIVDLTYDQTSTDTQNLTLTALVNQVDGGVNTVLPNLNLPVAGNILSVIVDNLLQNVLDAVGQIEINVPIQVPLLGIDDLRISGGWSAVTPSI